MRSTRKAILSSIVVPSISTSAGRNHKVVTPLDEAARGVAVNTKLCIVGQAAAELMTVPARVGRDEVQQKACEPEPHLLQTRFGDVRLQPTHTASRVQQAFGSATGKTP